MIARSFLFCQIWKDMLLNQFCYDELEYGNYFLIRVVQIDFIFILM